jgi:hypothetical protein
MGEKESERRTLRPGCCPPSVKSDSTFRSHPECNEAIRSHAEDLVLQRNPAPPAPQTSGAQVRAQPIMAGLRRLC